MYSVLMQWAEGGSLDDFIDVRLGRGSPHLHPTSNPAKDDVSAQTNTPLSRGARIRAFRAMQHASPEEREKMRREMSGEFLGGAKPERLGDWKAVHLLSAEEVKSLFQDVVEGLAFLVSIVHVIGTFDCSLPVQHDKSILHLDLKPGNVLLTWDEGRLMYVPISSCVTCSHEVTQT